MEKTDPVFLGECPGGTFELQWVLTDVAKFCGFGWQMRAGGSSSDQKMMPPLGVFLR